MKKSMSKKISNNIEPFELRNSLTTLKKELKISLLHCKGLAQAYALRRSVGLKLNLGCGQNIKNGWINIDLNGQADLTLDLRRPLPFLADSCSVVYSEHFLEHLSYPDEVILLLQESYRILEVSGVFSAGVPDTEWPLRAYFEGARAEYFRLAKEKWHPKWCKTKMEHINYHFRQGTEHKFAYDLETLKYILEKCGFTEVKRRDFDPELDSYDRRQGTLYVDAIKPDL